MNRFPSSSKSAMLIFPGLKKFDEIAHVCNLHGLTHTQSGSKQSTLYKWTNLNSGYFLSKIPKYRS